MQKANELTRIFVHSGAVTLKNKQGEIQASKDEAAVSLNGNRPEKLSVKANNSFATKLYKQLAKESSGKNLFISPYAISNALVMAAEGARGITAKEIGEVLELPQNLQRTGDDSQQIPWKISTLHTGINNINDSLNRPENSPSEIERKRKVEDLQQKISVLDEQLSEINLEVSNAKNDIERSTAQYEWKRIDKKKKLLQIEFKKLNIPKIRIANALWVDKSYPLNKTYQGTMHQSYGVGDLKVADFSNDPLTQGNQINEWVREKTQSQISSLFDPSVLESDAKMIITNAVSFQADWVSPFSVHDTGNREFTLTNGEKISTPMMSNKIQKGVKFFEQPSDESTATKGFSMIELPYQGGMQSMVILLPEKDKDLAAIESMITPTVLSAWIDQLKDGKVDIHIPKFSSNINYSNFSKTLANLGMPSAFSSEADFSGIGKQGLYIDTVHHQTAINVNEIRTSALSEEMLRAPKVTEEIKQTRSAPFPFYANRPFIYFIRDKKTGLILFMGRMMNPLE